MKRVTTPLIVLVLVAAAFALAGCAQWFQDPAKPANDAIAVANKHLTAAASLETSIQTSATQLDALPYTKAGANKGLQLTDSLMATLKDEKTELEGAQAAMDSIAKLDVRDEFKQFARLESTAISTRITLVDTNARLYDALNQLYAGLKSKKSPDPRQLLSVIDQVKSELAGLQDQAVQQAKAASDYFTAHKLGG